MFSDPQISKLMQKLQGGKGGPKDTSDSDMKDDEIRESPNDDLNLKESDFEFDNQK